MSVKARVIALYLPQFYPTENNDKWWGKGFTEWTNVAKAKPLFNGHNQPNIPADLGFYDLRLEKTREQQAELARNHGVEGFCYYHYWFGNGIVELDLPFNEVLKSGNPDFPFCLCWANESWFPKLWNRHGSEVRKPLVEQVYPGTEDSINHFNYVLPAFRDRRYIRVHGKPIFMIYRPKEVPDVKGFISLWQELAVQNDLPGIYFVAHTRRAESGLHVDLNNGFDAVNVLRLNEAMRRSSSLNIVLNKIKRTFIKGPRVYPYKDVYQFFLGEEEKQSNVFPCIVPNWDHTPRSGPGGSVLHNSTPGLFRKHVDQVLKVLEHHSDEEKIVFIKSWNEWGEGNYMEPDLVHGKAYLEALKDALDK